MRATISKDLQRFPCRRSKSGITEDEENILAFLLFVTLFLGGAIRLRLAGRTAAGKSFGGNLQGCCCNSDPRADDWPLADFGDSARCYHPATWWRHSTQVSGKERKLCVCHRLFIEVACSHFDVTCWFVSKLETLSLVFWPSNFVSLEPEVTNIVVLSPECYANPFQYGLCNMQALLPHRHMWTKLLFFPSTGAVQSSIGCLCQSTRAAAATAVPLSTNSPSAATITSGRGHQAALSNLWLPHHSPTHPTEPSASVAQWERRCQPRGWRGVVSSRGALAAMDDL